MSDINAAIQKVAEVAKEVVTEIVKYLEDLGKEITSIFEDIAEAINEAYKKYAQEEQKEPLRAKRPDYKQHIKAATKPPYIKQIRKARAREAFKK